MKIRCPHRCIYPNRTYEDVRVGDEVECSCCRQPFQVTHIGQILADDAPLPRVDLEGVPLSVPTEFIEAWKDVNWPGWRRQVG